MDKETLAFKEWAQNNYEAGGDTFVECYSDAELCAFVKANHGLRGAIKMAQTLAGIYEERRADARNASGCPEYWQPDLAKCDMAVFYGNGEGTNNANG